MGCPPQGSRWRLPAGDVLDATGRQWGRERCKTVPAPPLTSTMRCRSGATKAPRCVDGKTPTMRCRSAPTCVERQVYVEAAKEAGFRVIGYYFRSKVEDCQRRNAERPVAQQVP